MLHPGSYLGDALVHLSFPVFLYANDMFSPVVLLGPLANYVFLRLVGGDRENEASQARRYGAENVPKKLDLDRYREERNAFWPDPRQISNPWTWAAVGCGVAGAVAERVARGLL